MPRIGRFPTIILWALAAVVIVWFIWNKTTFGKNLFAVGGQRRGSGSLRYLRVPGDGGRLRSGGHPVRLRLLAGVHPHVRFRLRRLRPGLGDGRQSRPAWWGGISFTGGIGKISGVVVGVFIFTALTYSLTVLGIDTNLQFVFSGIIILVAVMLDCLKYVQKK